MNRGTILGLAVLVVIVVSCMRAGIDERQAAAEADQKQAALRAEMAAAKERAAAACRADLPKLTAQYEAEAKAGKHMAAADVLRACAGHTGEPALAKAVRDAEAQHWIATADDPKADVRFRVAALQRLQADHPQLFAGREASLERLSARLEQIAQQEARKTAAAEAARKRREGVRIGMSTEDVLASSWGKPRSVNRTTYSWGVKEQWVYDGGYLYFTNGVLDAIQN